MCAESQLSSQPACISSADATVNWCALVWKREVLLGASWGRTTARRGLNPLCICFSFALHIMISQLLRMFFFAHRAQVLYSHLVMFCVSTLLHRCVKRCHIPEAERRLLLESNVSLCWWTAWNLHREFYFFKSHLSMFWCMAHLPWVKIKMSFSCLECLEHHVWRGLQAYQIQIKHRCFFQNVLLICLFPEPHQCIERFLKAVSK